MAVPRVVAVPGLDPGLGPDRGRDAHYWAPPAQNRTCGFPAYGSHLGYVTVMHAVSYGLAVHAPAPVIHDPGSVHGACFAGSRSPRPLPFAPPAPSPVSRFRSPASTLLRQGLTSHARASSASAPRLPDAGRTDERPPGQTRDLPGSGGFPLCVMRSSTTTERRHLASRCRTCCLRLDGRPRPRWHCLFRGSIAHPAQSLFTLRGRRRRRNLTQHSLPGGRYPLPGPDFHRLEPASFLAHPAMTLPRAGRQSRGWP